MKTAFLWRRNALKRDIGARKADRANIVAEDSMHVRLQKQWASLACDPVAELFDNIDEELAHTCLATGASEVLDGGEAGQGLLRTTKSSELETTVLPKLSFTRGAAYGDDTKDTDASAHPAGATAHALAGPTLLQGLSGLSKGSDNVPKARLPQVQLAITPMRGGGPRLSVTPRSNLTSSRTSPLPSLEASPEPLASGACTESGPDIDDMAIQTSCHWRCAIPAKRIAHRQRPRAGNRTART